MHAATPLLVSMLFCAAASAQTLPPADAETPAAPDLPGVPAALRTTWSEVTGQRSGVVRDRSAAVIRRVDGRFVREPPRVRITAGEHDLVLQSPPRHGFGGTERHFRLQVEPCRRYYVNVQFGGAIPSDWTPVVAKSESIIGCRLPARRY